MIFLTRFMLFLWLQICRINFISSEYFKMKNIRKKINDNSLKHSKNIRSSCDWQPAILYGHLLAVWKKGERGRSLFSCCWWTSRRWAARGRCLAWRGAGRGPTPCKNPDSPRTSTSASRSPRCRRTPCAGLAAAPAPLGTGTWQLPLVVWTTQQTPGTPPSSTTRTLRHNRDKSIQSS